MNYRGYTIKKETEPWAIYFGWVYCYFLNEDVVFSGFQTIKECKDAIDESFALN